MKLLYTCIAVACMACTCVAYFEFQNRIPNGNNVDHPCKVNYKWPGVGHENPKGGGDRNQFGKHFQAEGFQWTPKLCAMDSDGDDKSNGEELGDPTCTWTPGTIPKITSGITHPGICNPYNSDKCKGKDSFVSCELDRFEKCDAVEMPDVRMLDLNFTRTNIPPTETNYYCMTFDLPQDVDYHIVANEPIIDNANVLHHMLLFGCQNENEAYIPYPQTCGMSTSKCGSIISGWTVGSPGTCFGQNLGFPFGKNGFKRVRLEIHYNNVAFVTNYTDASGIRLYYQPKKEGVQDLAVFTTGQMFLDIPPGHSRVEQKAITPGSCTKFLLKQPINVTLVWNHMHYFGQSMSIVVFRNGTQVKVLSHDEHYSYDSPVDHFVEPHFQLLPGDEIQTTCVYNSLSSKRYVYFGESTSDEMCFGFLVMYPAAAIQKYATGVSFGHSPFCSIIMGQPIDECDWVTFTNMTKNAKIVGEVMRSCSLQGFCRPECCEALRSLEGHPCLKGDANKWVTKRLEDTLEGLEFLARLRSCSSCTCRGQPLTQPQQQDDSDSGLRTSSIPAVLLLLTSSFLVFS